MGTDVRDEDLASLIAEAEESLRASRHAEAAALLQRLDPARLPPPLLDRALPTLLMAIHMEAGEFEARRVLEAITRESVDADTAGILQTYHAEAALDPRERAALARSALALLDGDAPISRHRALGSLVTAEVDLGLGLNNRLLEEMAAQEATMDLLAPVDSALAHRGFYAYQVGDLEGSRVALRALERQAREDGQPFMERVFRTHLAMVDIYAGRLAAAARALSAAEDGPMFPAETRALGLLAIRTGDEDALQAVLLQPTLHGSEATGEFSRTALTGLAAAARGDWREAQVQLGRARTLAEDLGMHEPGRRLWIDFDLAHAALQRGDPAEAIEIADSLEELAQGTRPLLTGVAERIHGLAEASVPRLESSAALLAGAGFPAQYAQTLLALGRAYSAAGRTAAALRALERAQVLVRRTGDGAISRSVRTALSQVSGDGPLAVLTPREREVARAAATGASSRQIAAAAFISVRTVESQLSSVYRKLGVHSRTQLAVLFADLLRDERADRG